MGLEVSPRKPISHHAFHTEVSYTKLGLVQEKGLDSFKKRGLGSWCMLMLPTSFPDPLLHTHKHPLPLPYCPWHGMAYQEQQNLWELLAWRAAIGVSGLNWNTPLISRKCQHLGAHV